MNINNVPFTRCRHLREEHLLPLDICVGLAIKVIKLVFDAKIKGVYNAVFISNSSFEN